MNIAVIGDNDFYNLLLCLGFSAKYYEESDSLFIKGNEYRTEILLADHRLDNISEICFRVKEAGTKVIVFGQNIDPLLLRNLYRERLIEDYILRSEAEELHTIIERIKRKRYNERKASVKNGGREDFIEISDIVYIEYDREERKTIINCDKDKYTSQKKLSEVEELLSKYNEFIKIERGITLNINKVVSFDFDNEFILLANGKKLFYSRVKIREIRERVKNDFELMSF